MAKKLLFLKGLVASGKSTYARQLVKDGNWKRVNKDDLRSMLDDSIHTKAREKFVMAAEELLAIEALKQGYNVVIDSTNFHPVHEKRFRLIAEAAKADFEIKMFDTPLDVCIVRDLMRDKPVGSKVIQKMYDDYVRVRGAPKLRNADIDLPTAILVDIDGTLAHMKDRSAFDFKRVFEDDVDTTIRDMVTFYHDKGKHDIILMSGRDSSCRAETEQWLREYNVPYNFLFMRAEGDTRKDSIVKEELYLQHIDPVYRVLFVLDDRDQVVSMWRKLGLKCLQVAPGSF